MIVEQSSPERKRTILEHVFRVWQTHPHLRLGQVIARATAEVNLEYVYDEELLALLEAGLNKTQKRQLDADFPLTPEVDYPPFG